MVAKRIPAGSMAKELCESCRDFRLDNVPIDVGKSVILLRFSPRYSRFDRSPIATIRHKYIELIILKHKCQI